MRKREPQFDIIKLFLALFLIAVFLGSGNFVKAYADENASVSLSVGVTQSVDSIGSDGNSPVVSIAATGLGDDNYTAYLYYKQSTSSSYSKKTKGLTDEGTAVFTGTPSLSNGRSYNIYVEVRSGDEVLAKSDVVTISAVKPSLSASDITVNDSIEGQSVGTISLNGSYEYVAYYRKGGSITDAVKVTGTTITGLSAGEYYVFVPAYAVGDTYYIKSSSTKVIVGETAAAHYQVNLISDQYSLWSDDDNTAVDIIQGSNRELSYKVSVASEYTNDYILDAVSLSAEKASLTVEKNDSKSWDVTISDITGNVDVSVSAKAIPYYNATLSAIEGAVWSGGYEDNAEVSIKSTSTRSFYVKSQDSKKYYVSGIVAEPESNISFTFNDTTGEVFISSILGDVKLIPQVEKKNIPASIEVKEVHFNDSGVYSEENPYIQVSFSVEVKDAEGNTVPGAILYFKDDESEVSYTQSRETDEDGIASFKYSYGVPEDETTADYKAVFATSASFGAEDIVAKEDIHLVLQLKKDLVLYEDQIFGTTPGESDGKVINVPKNYELWSGEAHQGAIVIGSGEWIKAESGEFTGLSAGQHLIRAGEAWDKENNTFYFASDYDFFTVTKGFYTITVNAEESVNVVFTQETEQSAEPGDTVYFYVAPADGYRIIGFSASKDSYFTESRYDEENGYIVLEGISGSFEIIVEAEAIESKTEDNSNNTQQNTENNQSNGGDTQVDQSTTQQEKEESLNDDNSGDTQDSEKQKKNKQSKRNTTPADGNTVAEEKEPQVEDTEEEVTQEVIVVSEEPVEEEPKEDIAVVTEEAPKADAIETTSLEDDPSAKAIVDAESEGGIKVWPVFIVLFGAAVVLGAAYAKKNVRKESK